MATQQPAETIAGAVDDLEYTVLARTSHTPNIIELELAPADERLSYRSGQYVLIGDPDHTLPVRSYSLANATNPSGRISLLVTEVPGGEMSTWLHRGLRIGYRVLVSGPYGTFVADPGADGPVLCLAAGSEASLRSGRSPKTPYAALALNGSPCCSPRARRPM